MNVTKKERGIFNSRIFTSFQMSSIFMQFVTNLKWISVNNEYSFCLLNQRLCLTPAMMENMLNYNLFDLFLNTHRYWK